MFRRTVVYSFECDECGDDEVITTGNKKEAIRHARHEWGWIVNTTSGRALCKECRKYKYCPVCKKPFTRKTIITFPDGHKETNYIHEQKGSIVTVACYKEKGKKGYSVDALHKESER